MSEGGKEQQVIVRTFICCSYFAMYMLLTAPEIEIVRARDDQS